jgi:hypothetical protein
MQADADAADRRLQRALEGGVLVRLETVWHSIHAVRRLSRSDHPFSGAGTGGDSRGIRPDAS